MAQKVLKDLLAEFMSPEECKIPAEVVEKFKGQLLFGEVPILLFERVSLQLRGGIALIAHDGILILTNFRLLFRKMRTEEDYLEIGVPLMLIDNLHKVSEQSKLKIYTSDLRAIRLGFNKASEPQFLYEFLGKYFSLEMIAKFFAMDYWTDYPPVSEKENGWRIFDWGKEFQRFGIPSKDWLISDINKQYQLCLTYPEILCLPSSIRGWEDIEGCARTLR
eukprot:TRINITY_DN6839_c0_g1_i1.p1 TRINITY_DN6839_c0_g1~~TRINITY_DN6839_c0_g1_i1.p1  ORF type:complete len:220 (+),score=25.19 TRINITY_DN6839_c0_g1_i1:209-868(+)